MLFKLILDLIMMIGNLILFFVFIVVAFVLFVKGQYDIAIVYYIASQVCGLSLDMEIIKLKVKELHRE
jgi:hypothetical protein